MLDPKKKQNINRENEIKESSKHKNSISKKSRHTKNENKQIKKCKKWLLLNDDIAQEYDISVIICGNCSHYAFPYFVHNDNGFGDYTCYICNESGDLQSYCVYCKQRDGEPSQGN